MPISNGRFGEILLPWNTYQPSLALADAGALVANWIQLSNAEHRTGGGNLVFFNQEGEVLETIHVELAPGERRDFSAHKYGASLVGLVRWIPDNLRHRYQLRNVRYLYDNPGHEDSFASAFQITGIVPSGERLVASFTADRAEMTVLELTNAKSQRISVDLKIYGNAGLSLQRVIVLEANASMHLLLRDLLLEEPQIEDSLIEDGFSGSVFLDADTAESLAAMVMTYRYDDDGSLAYLFGIQAEESLGTTLTGSYNTYLGQSSELLLVNDHGETQDFFVSLVSNAGEEVASYIVRLEPRETGRRELRELVGSDDYGSVTVQAAVPGSIVAQVLRTREGEWAIPTGVRQ